MERLIFILTLLTATVSFGQKQGNIWFFPQNSGLDFSSGNPTLLQNGQAANAEGCSSICDSAGTLLFYATATSVWNSNHTLMPNGSGLSGGNSSTQGALIVPQPESDNLFYVFTLDEFQNNLANGLRFSVVDMCLDNEMGDIIPGMKDSLLLNGTGEKMAATYHANGVDIWLVTRIHLTNEFYSFLITSSGISAPVVTAIGWANPQQLVANAIGQMKISPDGSKLAFGVGNQSPNILQLFDFDNSTGIISNLIDLPTSTNSGNPYGISFSPDNSKLYVWGVPPTGLNQFDLSSGIPDTIINSRYEVPWGGAYGGTGIQLANNGKIYVCQPPNIGVINFPNLAGNACNFVGDTIISNSYYSLPGFIDSYNYTNGLVHCSVGIDNDLEYGNLRIYPNPTSQHAILEFDNPKQENHTLDIYDTQGRCVRTITNITTEQKTVDISDLTSGLYFFQLHTHGQVRASGKLMVE